MATALAYRQPEPSYDPVAIGASQAFHASLARQSATLGICDPDTLRALDLDNRFLCGNLSPIDPAKVVSWASGNGRTAIVEFQKSVGLGDRFIVHTAGAGHWCRGMREAGGGDTLAAAEAVAERWVATGGWSGAA